jgi:transcriptional regulator with XRE-family HTH domain
MAKNAVDPNGIEIRKRRHAAGLSQDDLAEMTDLSKRTIENAEAGKPTYVSTIDSIAIALKCDVTDLINTPADENATETEWQQYLCSFDSLIDDLTLRYVPRTFITTQLDAFTGSQPSGYFVIKGDPGMGKSTVLAHLARSRGYIHHFNIASDLRNNPASFVNNVCAQLIRTFGVSTNGVLLGEARPVAGVLLSLLEQIKSQGALSQKLVILIDALDEANWKPLGSENVLDLPVTLPAGVFIVASTRKLHALDPRSRLVVRPFKEIVLDKNSEWQQEDAKAYIFEHVELPGVSSWIKVNKLTSAKFAALLLEKSEANFMYLRHVLSALSDTTESGNRFSARLRPDELPQGLREYYAKHWYLMQSQNTEEYDRLIKPILCVLGAVSEAVTTEVLHEITRIDVDLIERVLQQWHQFLHIQKGKHSERLYRLYSHSFREFLQSEVDPGLKRYKLLVAETGDRFLDDLD